MPLSEGPGEATPASISPAVPSYEVRRHTTTTYPRCEPVSHLCETAPSAAVSPRGLWAQRGAFDSLVFAAQGTQRDSRQSPPLRFEAPEPGKACPLLKAHIASGFRNDHLIDRQSRGAMWIAPSPIDTSHRTSSPLANHRPMEAGPQSPLARGRRTPPSLPPVDRRFNREYARLRRPFWRGQRRLASRSRHSPAPPRKYSPHAGIRQKRSSGTANGPRATAAAAETPRPSSPLRRPGSHAVR